MSAGENGETGPVCDGSHSCPALQHEHVLGCYSRPPRPHKPAAAHKVTWVAVDDWHAIYVDGVCIGEQGHSLSPWTWLDVLRALDAEVEDLRYSDIAERLAEETGGFPSTWPPSDNGGPR